MSVKSITNNFQVGFGYEIYATYYEELPLERLAIKKWCKEHGYTIEEPAPTRVIHLPDGSGSVTENPPETRVYRLHPPKKEEK